MKDMTSNAPKPFPALSGNALKLIAAAAMTCDHAGLMLFPSQPVWRAVGRLAFPIFAFCVAEGCRRTSRPERYLLRLGVCGLLCCAVWYFVSGQLYLNIFITYTIAAALIFAARRGPDLKTALVGAAAAALCVLGQPSYGVFGVFAVLLCYALTDPARRAAALGADLVLYSLTLGHNGALQLVSLLALPLILCYNGKRGGPGPERGRSAAEAVKWAFYLYYPLHLIVLWLISLALKG